MDPTEKHPNYFRVGFFGLGFPKFLRVSRFITLTVYLLVTLPATSTTLPLLPDTTHTHSLSMEYTCITICSRTHTHAYTHALTHTYTHIHTHAQNKYFIYRGACFETMGSFKEGMKIQFPKSTVYIASAKVVLWQLLLLLVLPMYHY